MDVYSFAKDAKRTVDQHLADISGGWRPEFPAGSPPMFVQIATRAWDQAPIYRPTFQEIVALFRTEQFLTECGVDIEQFREYQRRVVLPREWEAERDDLRSQIQDQRSKIAKLEQQAEELKAVIALEKLIKDRDQLRKDIDERRQAAARAAA
jgi:hypothetical protein